MRVRVRRKGFSKYLRRMNRDEIDFSEDWIEQICGSETDSLGGPIERPTDPTQPGGNAS